MTLRNTTIRYGSIAIFFHWIIAFSVIGMLLFGFFMDVFPKGEIRTSAINVHKLIGLIILCLMILRMAWTISNVKPLFPAELPAWQHYAERTGHLLFYILLIAMPISGWVMSTADDKAPHFFQHIIAAPWITPNKETSDLFWTFHSKLAWIIVAFIILHVLAALKHHFINKDNILKRMWFTRDSIND